MKKLLCISLSAILALTTAISALAAEATTEIIREDASVFDKNGTAILKQYFDRVSLISEEESAAKINKALQDSCNNFLSDAEDNKNLAKTTPPQSGSRYTSFAESEITMNKDGIFSVKIPWEKDLAGGYVKKATIGITFDLQTGERLSLAKALNMSDEKAKSFVLSRLSAYVNARPDENWYEDPLSFLRDAPLSDFDYYIENDSVFVCIGLAVMGHPNMGGIVVECPKNYIKVILNGQELFFDQPPVIKNDRTMVPLRGIFEALGYTLSWDQDAQTATADKGTRSIAVKVGSTEIVHTGGTFISDVPTINLSGRLLVPVRAISELSGYKVDWDQKNLTVIISNY